MGNLFIAVGVIYGVAICIQVLSCAQSVKQAKGRLEKETPESALMTPQEV